MPKDNVASRVLAMRADESDAFEDWTAEASSGCITEDGVDMTDVKFDPSTETRMQFLKRYHKILAERRNEKRADV